MGRTIAIILKWIILSVLVGLQNLENSSSPSSRLYATTGGPKTYSYRATGIVGLTLMVSA